MSNQEPEKPRAVSAPYHPAKKRSSPLLTASRLRTIAVATLTLAAMVPAALSVVIAFATIGFGLDHPLTRFFLYGGHAVLLGVMWLLTTIYTLSLTDGPHHHPVPEQGRPIGSRAASGLFDKDRMFLTDDKERIRNEFLEPDWLSAAASED